VSAPPRTVSRQGLCLLRALQYYMLWATSFLIFLLCFLLLFIGVALYN
jgi:hypothetical protein